MGVFTAKGPGAGAEWSTDNVTFVEIPEVTQHSLSTGKESKGYRSSSTNGAMVRIAGGEDHDGSIEVKVDDANPFDAGALGIVEGTNGYLRLRDKAGKYRSLPVYIEGIEYEADLDGQEIVSATINFSSSGNLTRV